MANIRDMFGQTHSDRTFRRPARTLIAWSNIFGFTLVQCVTLT